MKEVAIRQYQAGTSSVSVPLGGGIRYRVGGVRGRSVVIGSELVATDTGVLALVTSQRTVFTGQAKTLEFRNDKLVGMEQYTDGLRLNVSNRQTASLFKLPTGPSIAAALIQRGSGALRLTSPAPGVRGRARTGTPLTRRPLLSPTLWCSRRVCGASPLTRRAAAAEEPPPTPIRSGR